MGVGRLGGVRVGVSVRVRGVLETFRLESAEPIQELPLLRLLRNKRGGSLAIAAARAAICPSAAVAAVAADGVSEREELLAQRLVRVRLRLRLRLRLSPSPSPNPDLDARRELLREGEREERERAVLVELEQPLQRLARGRALVGRVVVRHAVHEHPAEAVAVRAPVRVDAEAAAVDRAPHDVRVAVEVLRERGELIVARVRRPRVQHRHVQAREREPGQLREPFPRDDRERDLVGLGARARARARARDGTRVGASAGVLSRVRARVGVRRGRTLLSAKGSACSPLTAGRVKV